MSDGTASVNHPLSSRGLFVPLDVNYADDPKMIEAGPEAELVYVRSLALAKRIGSDGAIHRAHLWRLSGDLPTVRSGESCPDDFARDLVRVGAWVEIPEGWRISAWWRWNLTTEEMESRRSGHQKGAAIGNHKRWHVARGVVDPDCEFCTDRSTESDRIGERSVSESTKKEIEPETKPETTLAPALRTRRPDPIWDALIDAWNLDPTELTDTERGRINKAAKGLRDIGADPAEIPARRQMYAVLFPDAAQTMLALVGRWAECRPDPARLQHRAPRAASSIARAVAGGAQ